MAKSFAPLFFATSGIRGKANELINPELALRVGCAVSKLLMNNYPNDLTKFVYIGFDNRRNSKSIANCLTASLSSYGIHVRQFNRPVPTPLVIFSTIDQHAHAGLMITGSHLPADDNGIILFDRLGNYYKGILPDGEKELVSWRELGTIREVSSEINDYNEFLLKISNELAIGKNNYKVLVDPVHGPMKEFIELILEPIVSEIVKINWEDDDSFPGRISEPIPKNIEKTRIAVLENNCDLGIATDMDGDRVIFITKNGDIVTGDYMGAILAEKLWEIYPELPIIAPINTSAIINIQAQKFEKKFKYCKVGPSNIIDAIRDEGAKYGFEETGKYIFNDYAIWPDSAITILMVFSLINKKNLTLDEIHDSMPKLTSIKTKIPFLRKDAEKIMKLVPRTIDSYFDNINSIDSMDGLRINFDDLSWLLLRPSGTEDYVRIFAEHKDPKKTEAINTTGEKIINDILKSI